MDVARRCVNLLTDQKLFEDAEHLSRFSELVNCYSNYPFFTKGICKCMYLSSWDMEHFLVILDILNDLTIGKSQDLEPMKDNGIVLESKAEGYEKYILQMSSCFLNEEPFEMPEEEIAAEGVYIIRRAIEASRCIDQAFLDAA